MVILGLKIKSNLKILIKNTGSWAAYGGVRLDNIPKNNFKEALCQILRRDL